MGNQQGAGGGRKKLAPFITPEEAELNKANTFVVLPCHFQSLKDLPPEDSRRKFRQEWSNTVEVLGRKISSLPELADGIVQF